MSDMGMGGGLPNVKMSWRFYDVDEVDGDYAIGRVQPGEEPQRLHRELRYGAGMRPMPGDRWLIDRGYSGLWFFVVRLRATPIAVTGDRSAGTALTALLIALEAIGFIDDQTVA